MTRSYSGDAGRTFPPWRNHGQWSASRGGGGGGGDTRITYIGNLPDDIRKKDIEHLFKEEEGFGRLLRIDIKNAPASGPPGIAYAFLDFETARGAADAVDRRDGYMFEGEAIRVELKEGFHSAPIVPKYQNSPANRVIVSNLPLSVSWQDLKDHMREAGDVAFVEIERPGIGIVRYHSSTDMRTAVKCLDRSVFRDSHGDVKIRVREDADDAGVAPRSRSRRRG